MCALWVAVRVAGDTRTRCGRGKEREGGEAEVRGGGFGKSVAREGGGFNYIR